MSLLDLLGITQILKDGVALKPSRKRLNFTGDVTVTDDPLTGSTTVDVTGGGGGGGGAVASVFGRAGAVVAQAADYAAGLIDNDSGVVGSTVKDALDALASAILANTSAITTNTGAIAAKLNTSDAKASAIANDSSVTGTTVKAALESLLAAIGVGGGGGWQTLLDLNLTTEAAFTFVDGANTWKGLTWTGQNIASATTQCAIVPGSGLVFDHNGTATGFYHNANTAPRIYLPCSQIPGFRLGRSRLRMTWQVAIAGADANFELAEAGFDNVPFVSGQKFQHFCTRGFDGSAKAQSRTLVGSNDSRVDLPSQAHDVYEIGIEPNFTVYRSSKISTQAASAGNAAEFTGLELRSQWAPYLVTSPGTHHNPFTAYYLPNGGASLVLALGCETGNTSDTLAVTFKRLRIEYQN